MTRYRSVASILLILALWVSPSLADEDAAARAEELFQRAKALMAEGEVEGACPLLEESQRLDPGGGTLLTLALCFQDAGRTASAVTTFEQALAQAEQDLRDDRVQIARQRIELLAPKLSRVVVRFDDATRALDGVRVVVDGRAAPDATLDGGVALDAGSHVIGVLVEGSPKFEQTVEIVDDGRLIEIVVPNLAPPASVPEPAPPPSPAPTSSPRSDEPDFSTSGPAPFRIATIGVGSLGLATLAASSFLALSAARLHADANATCPDRECSDQTAVEKNHDAGVAADWATGTVVAGSVVAAAALIVLLSVPDEANLRSRAGSLEWRF